MSITAVGSSPIMPPQSMGSSQSAAKDQDNDADDSASVTPVKAAAAPGTGQVLDISA